MRWVGEPWECGGERGNNVFVEFRGRRERELINASAQPMSAQLVNHSMFVECVKDIGLSRLAVLVCQGHLAESNGPSSIPELIQN